MRSIFHGNNGVNMQLVQVQLVQYGFLVSHPRSLLLHATDEDKKVAVDMLQGKKDGKAAFHCKTAPASSGLWGVLSSNLCIGCAQPGEQTLPTVADA